MTTMRTWFFTEDCYPDLPPQDEWDSIRVELPNQLCEPENAHRLYNEYLDIWCAADEMGLDIMVNEHHCMLAVLAKNFDHQIGSAVDNFRLIGEARDCVDETAQLDDALDIIKIATGCRFGLG